jgi:hypothetical protein
MADEKDTGFKVTDRRKFNSDGSPRDYVEPPADAAPRKQEEASTPEPLVAETSTDNVVSFPSEGAQKKEQAQRPQQAEAGQSPASSQAARAYQQVNAAQPPAAHQGSLLGLINMLASEAAMFLGLIESPVDGELKVDLDSAREMIDLLTLLEQKTKGNLTREEEKVFEDILAYLRMQYVSAASKR